MEILIASLACEKPIIMTIGCNHHIPHLPKRKNNNNIEKSIFNYKQFEERNWDKVLQKAKYSLRG